MLIVSSFIGGLFLGYIASILSFFVLQLFKEGTEDPKGFGLAALFLLTIFGTGLFYLFAVVMENLALFVGAAITFAFGFRPLFGKER